MRARLYLVYFITLISSICLLLYRLRVDYPYPGRYIILLLLYLNIENGGVCYTRILYTVYMSIEYRLDCSMKYGIRIIYITVALFWVILVYLASRGKKTSPCGIFGIFGTVPVPVYIRASKKLPFLYFLTKTFFFYV